jgi:hypothetical protein
MVRGLLNCTVLLTTYHSDDQIEHNEMGRACSRNGERRGATGFWLGILREELEEIGVYGRIILKWIFMKWDAVHGLIDLVEGRVRRWSLVNADNVLIRYEPFRFS